jgi:ketosteroid isomerase-like protein
MSQEENVRKASKQFYAALNGMVRGESGTMSKAWSHTGSATAMQPIGGLLTGWDGVRDSFEKFAEVADGGEVTIDNQVIRVVGELAYEVGIEHGKVELGGKNVAIDHRVTNIYQLEGGEWKLIHHHCDVSPAMVETVNSLAVKA